MKTIRCAGCSIVVAKIEPGSKLKKGMVCLCENCEKKRKSSEWAAKTRKYNTGSPFMDDFLNGIN